MKNIYYNREGKEISFAESDLKAFCAAKIEGDTYFLKMATGGQCAGQFYNPYNPFFQPSEENRFNSLKGKPFYEFIRVNEEVFNDYLLFLQTRNQTWLKHAERANVDSMR